MEEREKTTSLERLEGGLLGGKVFWHCFTFMVVFQFIENVRKKQFGSCKIFLCA